MFNVKMNTMKRLVSLAVTAIMCVSTLSAQGLLAPTENQVGIQTTGDFEEVIDASFLTELVIHFAALTDEERAEKIDFFLTQNRKYLPKNKRASIRETLMGLSESKLKNVLMNAEDEFKDPTTSLLLSIFLGGLGVDRFYIGDVGLGVLKLITFGGFGIWTLIDWFVIQKRTRNNNYKELMDLCGKYEY